MEIPVKKALTMTLAATMIAGFANQFAIASTPMATATAAATQEKLIGIWAMLPLRNGIANVVEFSADAKATLYSFNCIDQEQHPPEISDIEVSGDGKFIHFKSPARSMDLEILTLKPYSMELGMTGIDKGLNFGYLKVDKIKSLCALYPDADGERVREAARKTPFKASDFIQNPKIPAHSNMQQYIGKWGTDKAGADIEIVMDSSDSAYLSSLPSENWKYLFNDVHWVGDELHFRMFAYSDRPNLYRHPFHKFQWELVLKPSTNGKLIASTFINGKQHDESVLSRKDDPH